MDTDPGRLKGKRLWAQHSLAFAALAMIALVCGCGKSAHSVASSHSDLFSSPPLKDEWETTMTALQTNGFFVAATTLNKMRLENPPPTPDQLTAIDNTIKTLNKQMLDLANNGDANARNALQQLKGSQSHR